MLKRIKTPSSWEIVKKLSRDLDRLHDLERRRRHGQELTFEENRERLALRARRAVVEFRIY